MSIPLRRDVAGALQCDTYGFGEQRRRGRNNSDRPVLDPARRIHHKLRYYQSLNSFCVKWRWKTQLQKPARIESGTAIYLVGVEDRQVGDESLQVDRRRRC